MVGPLGGTQQGKQGRGSWRAQRCPAHEGTLGVLGRLVVHFQGEDCHELEALRLVWGEQLYWGLSLFRASLCLSKGLGLGYFEKGKEKQEELSEERTA